MLGSQVLGEGGGDRIISPVAMIVVDIILRSIETKPISDGTVIGNDFGTCTDTVLLLVLILVLVLFWY